MAGHWTITRTERVGTRILMGRNKADRAAGLSRQEATESAPSPGTPSYVYHYTSTAAFQNIIRSRSLWATHLRFLNDRSEYEVGLACVREIVKQRADDARSSVLRKRLGRVLRHLADCDVGVYASSLTTRSDDPYHWRAYACNRGVAIGFPRARLQAFALERRIMLLPCEYRPEQQRAWMRDLVDECVAATKDKSLRGMTAPKGWSLDDALSWKLPFHAGLMKNKSFDSEAEWRLIACPGNPAEPGLEERFRLRDGALVPYLEMPLPGVEDKEFWRRLRVRLSPGSDMALQEAVLSRFLKAELGVAVEVTRSSVPLWDSAA